MEQTTLTTEDIKSAFLNSGYEPPDIKAVKYDGVSRGAPVYQIECADCDHTMDLLTIWVYIREKDGKLYANL